MKSTDLGIGAERSPRPARGPLADGREIFYYDDRPGHDRSAADGRRLTPFTPAAELRYDPLTGDPVLIAAHRQDRTVNTTSAGCPLCPSRPGRLTEIPAADYDVVVFENRFPSLGGPVGGRCEVVCFTGEHERPVSGLPDERLATIGWAWADRTARLSRLPGVEQVFVFENRGAEVGATLSHAHGQIYAYPYLPPVQRAVLESAREHRARHGDCLLCRIVDHEAQGPRVVAATGLFIAYVPEAARWPFEVHLAPRACVGDLSELTEAGRAELMGLYADVLRRFEGLFDVPTPYMACWHQAPVNHRGDLDHFYGQVFTTRRSADKYKYLASSESAAGAFINDVLPETAAERLRDTRARR